jgi:hypothetical protein
MSRRFGWTTSVVLLALAASSVDARAQEMERRLEVVPFFGLGEGVGTADDEIQFGIRFGLHSRGAFTPVVAAEAWDGSGPCEADDTPSPDDHCAFETRVLAAGGEVRVPNWRWPRLVLGAEGGFVVDDGSAAPTASVRIEQEVPLLATLAVRVGWRYQWVFDGGREMRGLVLSGRFRVPVPGPLQ